MTLPLKSMVDVVGRPWALPPERLLGLGGPSFAAAQRSFRQFSRNYGVVAVIPILGILTHRSSWGTSTAALTNEFRFCLSDPSVKAIVFDVDSPGGEVAGTPELADEIFRSRGRKKTIAVANGEALSGAFWLASAAGELVVTPSGQVGSIGVVAMHEECSAALEKAGVRVTLVKAGKFKTDGNPWEPLADSGRADLQRKVDAFHEKFLSDVARGRSVSVSTVRTAFGQGRAVLARQAVAAGMADRVGTLDETLSRIVSGRDSGPHASASDVPIAALRRQLDRLDKAGSWRISLSLRRRELELH